MRWSWWSALAIALTTLASGCAPPASPGLFEPTPTALPTARPTATTGPAGPYTLGLVVPNPGLEPWSELVEAARQTAAQGGAELALAGPRDGPAERPAEQVRQLIRRRVDLLLLAGPADRELDRVLAEAAARGILLAGLDSQVSVERLLFRVGPDHRELGRLQARCLDQAVGARGSIGLLAGPRNDPAALERLQGFKETLQREAPEVSIVEEFAGPLNQVAAAAAIGGWLERRPELSGLATDGPAASLGALEALAAAGLVGQLPLATASFGPPAEAALREGALTCEADQQLPVVAETAVQTALAYLDGQSFERSTRIPPRLLTGESFAQLKWGVREPRR